MKPLSKPVRSIGSTKKKIDHASPLAINMEETEAVRFIRAWQASTSVEQVAETMGWTKARASGLASRLRKANIPLKRFKSRMTLDLNELRRIAKECTVTHPKPFTPSE